MDAIIARRKFEEHNAFPGHISFMNAIRAVLRLDPLFEIGDERRSPPRTLPPLYAEQEQAWK